MMCDDSARRIEGATDFACEDMELSGEGTSNSSILNHCTRIFHYKPPSSWGSPILGNHHTSWEMRCVFSIFFRLILQILKRGTTNHGPWFHSPDPSFSLEASFGPIWMGGTRSIPPVIFKCHICIWVKLATPVLRWTETNRLNSLVVTPILPPCPYI